MNTLRLITISLLATIFSRPVGMCTANAGAGDVANDLEAFKEQVAKDKATSDAALDELKEKNAELERQLAAKSQTPVEPVDSTLAMLCRGAGVDISDVRWRIQAGLDPDQAVTVALAQKEHNKQAEADKADGKSKK